MDVYQKLAGTTADSFRIAKNGPKIRPGTSDPNNDQIDGEPGDLYIHMSLPPKVYIRSSDEWMPLSTDQQFVRSKVQATTYIVSNNDFYLGVAATSAVSLYLPVGTANKRFIIKDESGVDRSIVIYPASGETIDGQSNFQISSAYSAINIVFGDEWHVF